MDVDIRYLPNQDPAELLDAIRAIADIEVKRTFVFPPAHVSRSNAYVQALLDTVEPDDGAAVTVGRDGASDAVSFLRAGIPAVEFGPVRRRPPRPRGMGLDRFARALSRAARAVRALGRGAAARGGGQGRVSA